MNKTLYKYQYKNVRGSKPSPEREIGTASRLSLFVVSKAVEIQPSVKSNPASSTNLLGSSLRALELSLTGVLNTCTRVYTYARSYIYARGVADNQKQSKLPSLARRFAWNTLALLLLANPLVIAISAGSTHTLDNIYSLSGNNSSSSFSALDALNNLNPFSIQKAQAAPTEELNFQGRLLSNTGALVADGDYNIEFKLYNVSTGGSALWTETYDYNGGAPDQRLRIANGYFTANLASLTSFPSTIDWSEEHWLTINIGGNTTTASYDGEMTPRTKLTSVPYAFTAGQLQATNAGFTTAVEILTPSADVNYQFATAPAGTYAICTAAGNCSGVTGSDLQTAYTLSTGGATPEITLDATRGALSIADASSALGTNLLEITNNAGSTTYFSVDAGGATVGAGSSITILGGATFPGSPTEGEIFFDSTNDELMIYNGTTWEQLNGNSSATFVVAASDSNRPELADYIADGTNDEVQIQAAIDALGTLGGTVYLMEGTFTVAASIELDDNITLVGAGKDATTITIPNSHNANLDVITESALADDVTVRDFAIDGNESNQASGDMRGVVVSGIIENMHIYDLRGEGINVVGVNNVYDFGVIRGNELSNNGLLANSDSQIYIQNAEGYEIVGNTVVNGNYDGIEVGPNSEEVTVESNFVDGNANIGIIASGSGSNRQKVVNNTVQNNTSHGIHMQSLNGLIDGNFVYNNAIGIELTSSDNMTVSNNSVIDNSGQGIRTRADFTLISGNNVDGSGGHGIDLNGASNGTVTGNVIRESELDGIRLTNASLDNLISDNNIYDTADTTGNYGIELEDSGVVRTRLIGNVIVVSSSHNDEIRDNSTDTVFLSQEFAGITQTGSSLLKASNSTTLTGTADPQASTILNGTGTFYTRELQIGDRITINSETRTVVTITNDNQLVVDTAFTDTASASITRLPAALIVKDSADTLSLIVADNGNVGIGTSSPDYELEVVGEIRGDAISAQASSTWRSQLSTLSGDGRIRVRDDENNTQVDLLADADSYIDTGFNLGIGLTDPSSLLQVDGALTVGDASNTDGTLIFEDASGTNFITILTEDLTADVNYRFDDESAGTYAICTAAGNCSGVTGSDLQTAYTLSTGGATPEITLDATRGALSIADASSALGTNLLEITNNAGSTTYFSVDAGGATVGAGSSITILGGATFPGSPTEGEIFFDSTNDELMIYNGTTWEQLNGNSSATFVVAASDSNRPELADYIADGTADQTEINAAITAANAAGGGTVYLMEGTYTVDDSVLLLDNVTLTGAGRDATTITIPNSYNSAINVVSETGTGTDVHVRDLTIDGNDGNQTSSDMRGISFNGVGDVSVINTLITDFRADGISITSSTSALIADNVLVRNATAGGFNQIITSTSPEAIVRNNVIRDGGNNGVYIGANSQGALIEGNFIENNTNHGITGHGSNQRTKILNNTSQDNGAAGIQVIAANSTVSGNVVSGNATSGINVTGHNSTVSNNIFVDNAKGLLNNAADYLLITGNSFDDNGTHSIQIAGTASFNQVVGNSIYDSTGTYGISIDVAADNTTLSNNTIVDGSSLTAEIQDDSTTTVYASQTTAGDTLQSGSSLLKAYSSSTLTGTANPTASTTLEGTSTSTLFTSELQVGDRITINAETRTVVTITDDDTLIVDTAFTDTADAVITRLPAALLVRDSSNNNILSVNDQGGAFFQNSTDSLTGFQILDADGGTPVFNVDTTNERVGIGTATPDAVFEVAGGGSSAGPWALLSGGSGTFQNTALRLQDEGSGPANILDLEFSHYDAQANARIRAESVSSFSAGGAKLILETSSDNVGTFNTSQLVLNNDGNVGIGTATPNYDLHVKKAASTVRLAIENEDNDTAYLHIGHDTAGTGQWATLGYAGGSDVLLLNNNGGGGSHLAIDTAGNVGIGTVTPSQALDVNGWIALTGTNPALLFDDTNTYIQKFGTDLVSRVEAGASLRYFINGVEGARLDSTGNFSIGGDTTPAYLLTVGADDTFGVDSSGNLNFEGSVVDGNETVIQVLNPTADITYQFADAPAGTYAICTAAGNCSGVTGSDLQTAYTLSTGGATPEITLDATRGALSIADASSALGTNLLEITNNAGSTTYFSVDAGGATVGAGSSITILGGATFPGSPTEGEIFFDSTNDELMIYNGTTWEQLNGNSSATFVVAASDSNRPELADYIADGTNDEVQIQAAIDALGTLGGTVYLMEGTFTVAASIELDDNITLVGAGKDATTITIPNSHNANLDVITESALADDVTVRDFAIDGNESNQASGDMRGVVVSGIIENMHIYDLRGEGIYAFGVNNQYDIGIIRNNELDNNGLLASTDSQLFIQQAEGFLIAGNTIVNGSYDGIYIGANSEETTISGNFINNNANHGITGSGSGAARQKFVNNTVQNNGANGINVPGQLAVVDGNSVYNNTGSGIKITNNDGVVISNNAVWLNDYGIEFNGGAENGVIADNTLFENTNDSIFINNATATSITGNSIYVSAGAGTDYGILLGAGVNDIYLADNNIDLDSGMAGDISDLGTNTIFATQSVAGDTLQSGSTVLKAYASSTLTGTANPTASTALEGTSTSTLFTEELQVGDRITINAETRTVVSITDDDTLIVDTAFY